MRTRVTREQSLYYVQFLEPKTNQDNFASEFIVQKWKYYGANDEEGMFNRITYGCEADAIDKAKSLSGNKVKELIWESV